MDVGAADRVVATAAGPVELGMAWHADGTASVTAWLLPAGRRLGALRGRARGDATTEAALDMAPAPAGLAAAMRALLREAVGAPPPGRVAAPAGLSAAEECDLRGWQWLLAELGEHRELAELAAAGSRPATAA